MNIWAVQIKRKSHSKEVLSAKLVDVDTMDVTELGSDMLIPAIKSGKFNINNLDLDISDKVVLTNYLKKDDPKKPGFYFHRTRTGDYLTESFVITLGGYDRVYDVVFDIPDKIRGAYRMFGDIDDIDREIKFRTEHTWENYAVYNCLVNDNDEMIYKDNSNTYRAVQFNEYKNIADIRNAIKAEYCTLTYVNNMLAISNVKFDDEVIELPEGIELFGYSHGGAYMVSMPNSIKKIVSKAFKNDEDILQVCINSVMDEIPAQLCIDTNLQIFEYTPKNTLNKICEGAFYGCCDMKQSLILNVKEVSKFAFAYSGIRRICLPCTTKICKKAFYMCDNLESARLLDVTVIEENAFADCTKLSEVRIDSVKYIYKGAFAGCRKLKQVNVPKDAVIEDGAFHKKTIVNRI